MLEAELKRILRAGTRLVMDAAMQRISIADFVQEYGNFYYYNALDGHEASPADAELLEKYQALIRLHSDVQQSVVDLTYLGDPARREEYLRAGRLDQDQAHERLARLAQSHDLRRLLANLESTEDT